MFRIAIITASLVSLGAAPAFAAQCRGPNGKFVKCATAAPAKPTRCKAANGKFAKCGTPGSKAI